MDLPFAVPQLSYEQVREYAEAFLAKYHSSRQIPVPIEEVVEFQLGIDIVPLPGIEESFDVVGFTSSDLAEISVDEYVYKRQTRRYRFTLAHEVGHVILHADLFKKYTFRNTEEWKQFIKTLPEMEYRLLELQAYNFAGLVLVPGDALQHELKESVRRVKAQGVNQANDFARDLVVDLVATRFEVSTDVVERRLNFDKIKFATFWP